MTKIKTTLIVKNYIEDNHYGGSMRGLAKILHEIHPNITESGFRSVISYNRIKIPTLFERHIESRGIEKETVPMYWDKTKDFSVKVNMPPVEMTDIYTKFEKLCEKHLTGKYTKFKEVEIVDKKACKVTISDSHIGMDISKDGVFNYEYTGENYVKNMESVFHNIKKEYSLHGCFDVILLDDLGDREDGLQGYTTRGGHALPQNMDAGEVFDVCVDTTVTLVRNIVESKMANKIILRCISNSNHTADFALIINKAIQKVINLLYSKTIVEVDILEKFIEYRVYGDHCFILTHGKDKGLMNRGFPVVLDYKTINFIQNYIDHYKIDSKYIHVEKGDLHQISYQKTKKFDYRNYMSLAPPSAWVQANFGDSYSGYSIQIVSKHSGNIAHTDYFIDYKKV